jgi:hypothetical protein
MNSERLMLYTAALKAGMDSRQASLYALGEAMPSGFWHRWHKVIGLIAIGFCVGFMLASYHWYRKARPIEPVVSPSIPAITNVPVKLNRQVNRQVNT